MSRPRAKLTNKFPGCPVESTLSFIDGKWKGVILYHLMLEGTLRFNELRRRVPSVTQRMLTKQLRELEEAELLSRTVFAVVPPRVDYALTRRGESLRPVIMALKAWGDENVLCDGERMVLKPLESPPVSRSKFEPA
ncbi:winged helix-turn-helix transcriptional regulator [Sinorhizobium saheli]|uniref:Transcriptional regulator n=1 Tax=Sinorhizobium saheli TaxID=36856 RepID=A0A178YB23_SINSA|nr:helix-turn-helix domain-containing protein [Sinorhizobium saheli]MQW88409.1 transcriptional regulator [Sinorhizobium saheli]OAP44669.1 transcriptional regulator [Sinorhizobium saheli]